MPPASAPAVFIITSSSDEERSIVKSCSASTNTLSVKPRPVTIAIEGAIRHRRRSALTPKIPNGTNSRMFCTMSGSDKPRRAFVTAKIVSGTCISFSRANVRSATNLNGRLVPYTMNSADASHR